MGWKCGFFLNVPLSFIAALLGSLSEEKRHQLLFPNPPDPGLSSAALTQNSNDAVTNDPVREPPRLQRRGPAGRGEDGPASPNATRTFLLTRLWVLISGQVGVAVTRGTRSTRSLLSELQVICSLAALQGATAALSLM